MKKYSWAIVVLVVVLVVGIYIATKEDLPAGGYNVGLISILSGDYAAVGENMRNGAILAQEEYNQAHPEAKINLFIEDDGFNAGRGISAYQKLVGVNKIDALINVSTPTIDGIYDSVVESGMPVIQFGEQGKAPTDDNVFGVLPDSIASEYQYGVYMKNKGVTEMVLVYSNIDAMIRFVDAFKSGFGGKTTDFVINADEKDFRTIATKVAALNSDNIGFFIVPDQGAQFINEFAKVKKNKPQFFFDSNFQSGLADYNRLVGDVTLLDGAIVGTIKSSTSDEFKEAYKKRFGAEPGFFADIGYDGFNLLVETHNENNNKWVESIKKVNYDGVSGAIKFTPTGNREPEPEMMTVSGGKLVGLE